MNESAAVMRAFRLDLRTRGGFSVMLSGFAALLCGKALPFRPGAKALISFLSFCIARKGEAFPHSQAAEPLVLHALLTPRGYREFCCTSFRG